MAPEVLFAGHRVAAAPRPPIGRCVEGYARSGRARVPGAELVGPGRSGWVSSHKAAGFPQRVSLMTVRSLAASAPRAFAFGIAASILVGASANAAVVVGWTINTAFPTGVGNIPTGTSYSPPNPAGAGLAETGANIAGSQLRSVHASSSAQYTSPAGNGSQYSFSSTFWAPGDYYEARFSTVGFTDISVSWDQARSASGPAAFKMFVSLDGGTIFTEVFSYTVLQSGGGSAPGTWTTGTPLAIYGNTVSLGTSADNLSLVVVRFQNAEALASATNGTNRIDNVFVNGIPSPAAIAVLGLAGLVARRRR